MATNTHSERGADNLQSKIERVIWKHYNAFQAMNGEAATAEIMEIVNRELAAAKAEGAREAVERCIAVTPKMCELQSEADDSMYPVYVDGYNAALADTSAALSNLKNINK